jgi:hypothetical protein
MGPAADNVLVTYGVQFLPHESSYRTYFGPQTRDLVHCTPREQKSTTAHTHLAKRD